MALDWRDHKNLILVSAGISAILFSGLAGQYGFVAGGTIFGIPANYLGLAAQAYILGALLMKYMG